MPQNENSSSNNMAWLLGLLIVALLIIGVLYYKYEAQIHSFVLMTAATMLDWIKWFPFQHDKIVTAAEKFQTILATDPTSLSFFDLLAVCGFVFRYYAVPCVPMALVIPFLIYWANPIDRFTRRFNLKTYLAHASKQYPHLLPVATRNIEKESLDKGPWRVAERPEQWAINNQLLLDKKNKPIPKKLVIDKYGLPWINSPLLKEGGNLHISFDKAKAKKLLEKQLGPAIPKNKSFAKFLPDYAFVLCSAFIAFGLGDREACYRLLDGVSLEFDEKKATKIMKDAKSRWVNIGLTEKLLQDARKYFRKASKSNDLQLLLKQHNHFSYTAIVALKKFAAAKGSLNTAQFIWLRPLNRPLFYALNQLGSREAWLESSAVFSHMIFEELLGKAIPTPQIEPALDGIIEHLQHDGWLPTAEQLQEVA